MSRDLLTSDKESITEQSKDSTEVQLGKPVSFIGVSYRNMAEGSLIGGKNDSKTAVSARTHRSRGDSSQKLGPWDTLHDFQAAQPVRVSLPNSMTALRDTPLVLTAGIGLEREGPRASSQFQSPHGVSESVTSRVVRGLYLEHPKS